MRAFVASERVPLTWVRVFRRELRFGPLSVSLSVEVAVGPFTEVMEADLVSLLRVDGVAGPELLFSCVGSCIDLLPPPRVRGRDPDVLWGRGAEAAAVLQFGSSVVEVEREAANAMLRRG